MDHKYQSIFKVASGKLSWLLGISLVAVLMVQFIELPHGNVLSLLFSVHKASFAGEDVVLNIGEPSPSVAWPSDNVTLTEDLNTNSLSPIQGKIDDEFYIEKNGSISSNETLSRGVMGSNVSSEVDDYSTEDYVVKHEIITVDNSINQSTGGYAAEEDGVPDVLLISSQTNATVDRDSSLGKVNSPAALEHRDSSMNNSPSPAPAVLPSVLSENMTALTNVDNNITSHLVSSLSNTPSLGKDLPLDVLKDENSERSGGDKSRSAENSAAGATRWEERPQTPAPAVVTISEMNRLLEQSLSTYRSMVGIKLQVF